MDPDPTLEEGEDGVLVGIESRDAEDGVPAAFDPEPGERGEVG
jgi:hypothetical protein